MSITIYNNISAFKFMNLTELTKSGMCVCTRKSAQGDEYPEHCAQRANDKSILETTITSSKIKILDSNLVERDNVIPALRASVERALEMLAIARASLTTLASSAWRRMTHEMFNSSRALSVVN